MLSPGCCYKNRYNDTAEQGLRWLFQGKKAAESKARVTFGHFVLFSLLINSLQNRTLTDFRLGKPRQGTQTKVVFAVFILVRSFQSNFGAPSSSLATELSSPILPTPLVA
jgi:hypothetical protein